MEFLRAAFERVKEGEAQVVDIVGEAGVGKSRLAYEFKKSLGDRVTLLTGGCVHYGRNINFLPVIDLLKGFFWGLEEGMAEEERGPDPGIDQRSWSAIPFIRNLLSLKVDDPTFAMLNPEGRSLQLLRRSKTSSFI